MKWIMTIWFFTTSYIMAVAQDFLITAGDPLEIRIDDNQAGDYIQVNGNFGTTLLAKSTEGVWIVPATICNHQGVYDWYLSEEHKGLINVSAQPEAVHIDQYYGPMKIIIDDNESAEIVTILTDRFDNIIKNPVVNSSTQYKGKLTDIDGRNQEHFHTSIILSEKASGKKVISTEVENVSTSEKEIQLVSKELQGFKIAADLQSKYADGHQILRLYTNPIRYLDDQTVVDGTVVKFYIETSEQKQLYTQGVTINGVAEAYMLHPDVPSKWTVTANIIGYKKSKAVDIVFKDFIQPFQVKQNSEALVIGPVKGPKGQNVHDGTRVYIHYKSSIGQHSESYQLKNGVASIPLSELHEGAQNIIIQVGRHSKKHIIE